MKMWKVGRSLVEGEKDVDDRDLDVSRLKVKYTHLAHDKVCQSVRERDQHWPIATAGLYSFSSLFYRTSTLWTSHQMIDS